MIDVLEPRQLLAASAAAVLQITGTSGDDVIIVRHNKAGLTVIVNGTVTRRRGVAFARIAIDGRAGNDTLDVRRCPLPTSLNGGDGDDFLLGGARRDILDGGAGNDRLHGFAGHDLLRGGLGDDALFGHLGNDVLSAEEHGSDTFDGGAGNNHLRKYSDPVLFPLFEQAHRGIDIADDGRSITISQTFSTGGYSFVSGELVVDGRDLDVALAVAPPPPGSTVTQAFMTIRKTYDLSALSPGEYHFSINDRLVAIVNVGGPQPPQPQFSVHIPFVGDPPFTWPLVI